MDLTRHNPESIGPYPIEGVIGEGAMGVVYRGRRDGAEPVALKTVRMVDAHTLAAIRREAHALSRIEDPTVVRLIDHGVADGRPWLAMELLEGQTLEDRMDAWWSEPPREGDGRSAAAAGHLEELLELVRGIATGLHVVHEVGIVHRDLKPANIFIREDGRPTIFDFGLVKRFTGGGNREVLDSFDSISGTPDTMAPEQIRGEYVDARTDLYALGCILYRGLTGLDPFDPEGQGGSTTIRQRLRGGVCPPSEYVDGVDPSLDALVLRLLDSEPRRRVPRAADVLLALGDTRSVGDGPASPATLFRAGFAGRGDELEQLEGTVDALLDGRGGLVLVDGPSGAGKTRLLVEMTEGLAYQSVDVVTAECQPLGGSSDMRAAPLHPIRPWLLRLADRCRAEGAAMTESLFGRHLHVLAPFCPELRQAPGAGEHPVPPGLAADAATDRLLDALRSTMLAAAAIKPLVFMIDDLQWADDLTLAFIERFAREDMTEVPVLMVGGYRSEQASSRLDALAGSEAVSRISLSRLDETSVASIVQDMLAVDRPPEPFVGFLSEHSTGNPFFVAEYIRAAVVAGTLRRGSDGSWALPTDREGLDALGLPLSLEPLIAQRIDGLTASTAALLGAAAVLGRDIDGEQLVQIHEVSDEQLLPALDELVRRQVLVRGAHGDLRIAHDQLRERAYEAIEPERRRTLHARAAQMLEERSTSTEHLVTQAFHWDRAGREDRALPCLLDGARRAMDEGANVAAVDLSERALAIAQRPDAERAAPVAPSATLAEVLAVHGRALWSVGRNDEAEALVTRSLALQGTRYPDSTVGWVLKLIAGLLLQVVWRLRGGRDRRTLEPDAAMRGETMLLLPQIHMASANDLPMLATTLHCANFSDRTGMRAGSEIPYSILGLTTGLMRLSGVAQRYFELALRDAGPGERCRVGLMQVVHAYAMGQWDSMLELCTTYESLAEGIGDVSTTDNLLLLRGQCRALLGDDDSAQECWERSWESSKRRQYAYGAWNAAYLGALALRRGRPSEAIERAEQAKASLTGQSGSAVALSLAVIAAAQLDQDRGEPALAAALEALELLQGESLTFQALTACSMVPDVLFDLQARNKGALDAELRMAMRRAVRLSRALVGRCPAAEAAAWRVRARLEQSEGRTERAEALAQRALEAARRLRLPWERTLVHLQRAEALRGSDPERAQEHAEKAAALSIEHGWTGLGPRLAQLGVEPIVSQRKAS